MVFKFFGFYPVKPEVYAEEIECLHIDGFKSDSTELNLPGAGGGDYSCPECWPKFLLPVPDDENK